ncbi:hypothetical protein QBC34DRAFT_412431 [Podospora aff. communis PSN243]|uniref:DUF6536 domain-containing protein n=1 Tax=Podospora aff. communis PSN243 TaxID=3040156 RepID=A0AAV9GBS1_9PEZI|nr:hypothetical protein QBC34DRAFT_412431 [Podospora aff. communis PSN243]
MDFNLEVPLDPDERSRNPQPARQSWRKLVGWRRAAAYLLAFTILLTLVIISCLFVSLYGLDGSPGAISDRNGTTTTMLFTGDCKASTQYNFWAHLVINFVASGILASSNFFMQALVAPTREEVDRAHAKGKALEIGVQSWRNLFHVALRNKILWVALSLSTIPLHLTLNSAVLESRASTDFLLMMASEPYLTGAPWNATVASLLQKESNSPPRLREIQKSLAEEPTRWERMTIEDCFARYNDTSRGLSERRDVIMVLELANSDNSNTTGSFGWSVNGTAENSLWYFRGYHRTDYSVYQSTTPQGYWIRRTSFFGRDERNENAIDFDPSTYTVRNNASRYPPELRNMKAQYCMSELWTAPCRVEADNALLTTVAILCGAKCILCIIVLLTAPRSTPLITPGDAIESFTIKPDPTTVGMCTFSCSDFDQTRRQYWDPAAFRWVPGARPWWRSRLKVSRRSMFAVPLGIWIWSYLLIGGSLVTASVFVGISMREQSIEESDFGHAPTNAQMQAYHVNLASTTNQVVLANTPQLILSMCYFAYNGLFTRILSEWEWARFSTGYTTLRVTHRKGQQRSTYRLQLPYRWSLPLLSVSALLHWLYSNSLYITIYEGFRWPQDEVNLDRGLAYSSKSIFISFIISISVAIAPLILGCVKLPGTMPMARNSSAVISAACHAIPVPPRHGASSETLDKPLLQATSPMANSTEYKSLSNEQDALWDMATGLLRWGVISPGWPGRVYPEGEPGHLAFGSPVQDIQDPVEGSYYAGKKED